MANTVSILPGLHLENQVFLFARKSQKARPKTNKQIQPIPSVALVREKGRSLVRMGSQFARNVEALNKQHSQQVSASIRRVAKPTRAGRTKRIPICWLSGGDMICYWCSQKFMATGIIKCKIDGRVISRELLLSKRPYDDCPVEPKKEGKEAS